MLMNRINLWCYRNCRVSNIGTQAEYINIKTSCKVQILASGSEVENKLSSDLTVYAGLKRGMGSDSADSKPTKKNCMFSFLVSFIQIDVSIVRWLTENDKNYRLFGRQAVVKRN